MNGFKRLNAVMICGFIGDAAGAPFEFRKRREITPLFPNKKITEYFSAFSHKGGLVTDDSQMTAFTLEGLISALRKDPNPTVIDIELNLRKSYSNWLLTQGLENGLADEKSSLLLSLPIMHQRRSPGQTCISALAEMYSLMPSSAQNHSRGSGAVMRVAPIGMLGALKKWEEAKTFDIAECSAFITHNHPTAASASGLFAVLVQKLLNNTPFEIAVSEVIAQFGGYSYHKDAITPLKKAVKHIKDRTEDDIAIADIGEGWVSDEALGIAVYCVMKAVNFENLMYLSIAHDGDSDSTASIAGNLWGACYSLKGVSDYFIDENELSSEITPLIMGLAEQSS